MSTTGLPRAIGPYQITGLLGEGGMGVVYRGISPAGEQVAVKQIRTLDFDDEERGRFGQEMEALKTVFGPRTATFIEGDADAERPWLAMQYIPGATLREWVGTHGPMEPALVAIVGAALAEGLAAIHHAGLLHRDLKPHNIVLAHDGPMVVDFGLALLTAAKMAHAEDAGRLSGDDKVVGTLVCMAPEQVTRSPLTPATDMYGLGATLLYAATRHYPFTGASSAYDLMRKIESPDEAPDLSSLHPDLIEPISALLAHVPSDRPSLGTTLDLLLAVVRSAGLTNLAARDLLRRTTAADVRPVDDVADDDVWPATPKARSEPSVTVSNGSVSQPELTRVVKRLRSAYARGPALGKRP